MNKSDSIKEVLTALSAFQGELENVGKDSKGVLNKAGATYQYASLDSCINTAKPILVKHGLSVSQFLGSDINGNATLETMLGHSSGEYISSACVIPIATLAGGGANNPAQVMGASVTYMRRYQYAAILGLSQEDDDAASATKGAASYKEPKEIIEAVNNNNVEYVHVHWDTTINKAWPNLSPETTKKLNELINQETKGVANGN